MTPTGKCQVCDATDWRPLPDPDRGQSVTTASRILDEPLGKSQCRHCGFVQRIRIEFLGLTSYYEDDYATYYERAGTAEFHRKRYAEIVGWMKATLGDSIRPKRIIDIGCGQGWAMEAIRDYYPASIVEGLEPSHYNVKVAREKGFEVHEGKLEDVNLIPKSYDLVFCNNVIQHVNNARDFLLQLKSLVTAGGAIVITCPDGSRPNIEILWSDQNFSFLPQNLLGLTKDAGFQSVYWTSSTQSPSLPPAQLLLMSNNPSFGHLKTSWNKVNVDLEEIYALRSDYLNSFQKINAHLLAETAGFDHVFNLGASYWTSVLAAYCRGYWEKVDACVVDHVDEKFRTFLNKPIRRFDSVRRGGNDALVLGIGPGWQSSVKDKFKDDWKRVVVWESFVGY